MIVTNKIRNPFADPASVGLRPFSARSIVLSVLLGGNPPRLPVSAIMALAELFEIPSGTMRTALSRMVGNGELSNHDAVYELSGRLLERRRLQNEGRLDPPGEWHGDWISVVVRVDRRSVATRRAFRSTLTDLRFGELRPDTWLRPDNLGAPVVTAVERLADVLVIRGSLAGVTPGVVAKQLWPLDELARHGHRLLEAIDATLPGLDGTDPSVLPDAFTISAAAVRHLTVDPRLPASVLADARPSAPPWPAHDLRIAYDDYERRFQRLLHDFLVDRAG